MEPLLYENLTEVRSSEQQRIFFRHDSNDLRNQSPSQIKIHVLPTVRETTGFGRSRGKLTDLLRRMVTEAHLPSTDSTAQIKPFYTNALHIRNSEGKETSTSTLQSVVFQSAQKNQALLEFDLFP